MRKKLPNIFVEVETGGLAIAPRLPAVLANELVRATRVTF
jgi:hypothetical protein